MGSSPQTSLALLVALGNLKSQWAGLRSLGDATSVGPLDHHAVGWHDPMKDREIGRYLQRKQNGHKRRENDIFGNAAVEAVLLAPCQSLARFSCSAYPILALLRGLLQWSPFRKVSRCLAQSILWRSRAIAWAAQVKGDNCRNKRGKRVRKM